MKRITSLLLFLQALTLTTLCHAQAKPDWKQLNESGYSIQYPSDWELNTSRQMGTSFVILSMQATPQDQFRENVNLLIQDLTGHDLNLDKYTEISEGQITTMLTNGVMLESKRIKAGGSEFHKLIYTGDQEPLKLKFEQYYWVKNNNAYVLTFTTEVNQFDAFKETGEKILNSFILK